MDKIDQLPGLERGGPAKKFYLKSLLVAFLVIGAFISSIHAQEYFPIRPLTIICPFSAGGGTDAVARILAVLMEKDLGQPVKVVNITGRSGVKGHLTGATAAPNGYTLCITTSDITLMHWIGLTKLNYKDIKGVALVNYDPASLNVQADSPWRTLKQVQDYIRANPGQLKASGTGKGGIWNLALAGWLKTEGIPINAVAWVPSNGAAPALKELTAGKIQIVCCSLPEALADIKSEKVRPLAIMSDKRDELFPDISNFKELGINWTMGAWRGITVPKKTPEEIVIILEKSIEKAVNSQEFKKIMQLKGYGIWFEPSTQFNRFMAHEDEIKGSLAKELGTAK